MGILFKRKPVSREKVLASTNEFPIEFPLPPLDPSQALGRGFNIVKVVEEHAPNRIKEIQMELDQLNKKHMELSFERLQLTRLLDALKSKD